MGTMDPRQPEGPRPDVGHRAKAAPPLPTANDPTRKGMPLRDAHEVLAKRRVYGIVQGEHLGERSLAELQRSSDTIGRGTSPRD